MIRDQASYPSLIGVASPVTDVDTTFLSLPNSDEKFFSHKNFETKKEKDVILKYINNVLGKMEFSTKEKKDTQKKVWKRVIGKAMLTKREAFAVMGFLRKLRK